MAKTRENQIIFIDSAPYIGLLRPAPDQRLDRFSALLINLFVLVDETSSKKEFLFM